VRCSPPGAIRSLARRIFRVLPRPIARWVQRLRDRHDQISVGSVHFGDLKRLSPISSSFGFDRGTPVDRYYIERFLARNAVDVGGRVLEIGDNSYTLRFGGDRVTQSDIWHGDASNPRATFVGDLAQTEILPTCAFDCIVFTQTLQCIFDVKAALTTLYNALKPGGVLLMTAAGLSKMNADEWPWYWCFAPAAIRRFLEDQFGRDAVSIEAHGNVFTATAFLHGVALEELDLACVNTEDSNYPIVIAARAIRPKKI
jgi:hypothetical protein